jgi:hypothetical protein
MRLISPTAFKGTMSPLQAEDLSPHRESGTKDRIVD